MTPCIGLFMGRNEAEPCDACGHALALHATNMKCATCDTNARIDTLDESVTTLADAITMLAEAINRLRDEVRA